MYILKKKGFKTHPIKEFRNGAFSPSSLGQVYDCSGFRLLADTDDSPEHEVTTQGKELHKLAEDRIKRGWKKGFKDNLMDFSKHYTIGDKPETDFVGQYVHDAIMYKKTQPTFIGTEVFVADTFYSDLVGGYVDFLGYNKTNRSLDVWDLKTGFKPITENQKYQLYFYALGAMNLLKDWDLLTVNACFFTRYATIGYTITLPELLQFKRHVSERIRRMQFNVGNHCKDCFHFKKCVPAHKRVNSLIKKKMAIQDSKQWGELYAYKPLITKYFDFIDSTILDKHYETGKTEIGAFEVYETPGRKNWVKDKIPLVLSKPELTKVETKPISVKQALDKGLEISNLWELKKTKKVRLRKEVKERNKLT